MTSTTTMREPEDQPESSDAGPSLSDGGTTVGPRSPSRRKWPWLLVAVLALSGLGVALRFSNTRHRTVSVSASELSPALSVRLWGVQHKVEVAQLTSSFQAWAAARTSGDVIALDQACGRLLSAATAELAALPIPNAEQLTVAERLYLSDLQLASGVCQSAARSGNASLLSSADDLFRSAVAHLDEVKAIFDAMQQPTGR